MVGLNACLCRMHSLEAGDTRHSQHHTVRAATPYGAVRAVVIGNGFGLSRLVTVGAVMTMMVMMIVVRVSGVVLVAVMVMVHHDGRLLGSSCMGVRVARAAHRQCRFAQCDDRKKSHEPLHR